MALQLKGQANYLNKYDYFHDQFKATSKFFNEDDWYKIASGNDSSSLDMYIDALGKAKNIDKIKFDKDYKTEYEDSETRLAALYNEVYGSRIANDDRYTIDVYKYDDAGNMLYDELGNHKTEKVTVSEYEYNKMVINQQNSIKETLHLRDLAREAKDPTIWADVASGTVHVVAGGLDFFNSVYALGATLIDMASSDKTFADDWFNQWEIRYKPILEHLTIEGKTLSDHLIDFETEYSHLRDVDGNLTTAGRIVSGVATTTGEMLASAGLGKLLSLPLKGLGAAGTATKGAKIATMAGKIGTDVIRTATYYTPIAARSMGETYKQLTANGQSISTAKMFENQAIKTGLEIAIERGLGAALGATGLDKFLFGTKNVGALKSKGATFWKGVGHYALDAGQEGLEEFLQELSGYFVDFCMEDFEADFSWQNLSDAFIIGAITSGAHSLATIAATKGKVIKTPDGEIRLGKVASAYYNTSMPTFLDDLYKTQKALDDLIYELPTAKRVEELNQKKSDLVKELVSVQNEIISNEPNAPESNEFNKAKKTEYVKKAQEVASNVGKGFRLTRTMVGDNERLELIKDKDTVGPETAGMKKASIVKKIESIQNEINKIANIQEKVDAKVESTGTEMNRFAEALRGVYAAARTVQSVAGEIGEERMKKAAEILQKIEDMGKAGKFNQSEILKSYDHVSSELQLHGTHVSKSLMKRIKESGITKIKHVFKREDVEGGNIDYSNDERRRVGKVVDELLKSDEKLKTVAISEDGKKVAADDETIILPEKEAALGTAQILHDDAEQRLCQAILNYRFHGDVLNRVLKTYRRIVKSDATDSEIIHALLFDESFFFTMLAGDSDKNVPIADTDMYQFLSSLLYIERNIIVDNIRTGVYDNKIKSVKEYMTKSLTHYLKIQPFADYQLDILSKAQRDSIKAIREGFAVANRIVAGKMTDSDRKFIYDKINYSNLSKDEKDSIGNTIDKGNQLDKRNALIKLDESYRVAFYGSYDGKTYLPTNSIRNQVVNQLLYSYNITVSNMISGLHPEVLNTIKKLYGNVDAKTIVKFLSNQISMRTNGRYALEITDANVDYASGIFESEGIRLKVIDKKSAFESSNPELAYRVKEKTNVSPSTRHSQMVVKLLSNDAKSKGAGYYTINDVVMNPSLLKDTVRANIQREYLEVTPDTVYKYLKSYYAKTEKVTLSLMSDGRVIFTDVTPVTEILSDNFTIEKVKAVANGEVPMSELVNSKYRIPLMDECQIVFSDSPNYYSSVLKTGKGRGTKQAVIELSKSSANNLEALKIEFAHELQHLIQEATMMNTGSKADVLSLFDKDTADKIRNEVVKRIPGLFTGVDLKNKVKVNSIVNKFLYYGSGEYAAYGAEASNVSKIYPVLIQERGNNVVLTLPWGESFVSEQSGNKQMTEDREFEQFYTETSALISAGDKNVTDVINGFYRLCDDNDVRLLANKVFENVKDVSIKFVSQEEITSIAGKNAVGIYVNGVIYYNSTYLNLLFDNGDFNLIAEDILHEFIHYRTVDVVKSVEEKLKDKKSSEIVDSLTESEKGALTLIQLYKGLKFKNSVMKSKVDVYGMTDVYEFIAELSDSDFRQYLKEQTLWDKILNAIKAILGLNGSVYDTAMFALERILDTSVNDVVVSNSMHLKEIDTENKPVTFIEHSTHQKSKGRTPRKRVPKKASKGTPLEPFAGRRLSLPLQDFIMKSAHEEYSGIDRGIKKKIIEGTLYTADLYEYLRECNVDDPAAEKTFKLINDTIFHNKHITSLKQLDEYIHLRTSVYYGLRAMFRGTGYYDKLVDLESAELYDKALELIEADPVLKKRVENISNNYWAGPVISEKNLRRLWMQHFDGSIESGGYIAGVARVIAFQGWLVTGGSVTSQSINRAAGGGKDGAKSSRTVEEMTPDKNDLDDFNRFISDKHEELLSKALEREFVESLLERKNAGENISLDELYKWRLDNKEYITSLRDSNPSEFWKLYTQYVSQNEREVQAMYIQTLAKESMGKEDATVDEALDELDREEAMNNAKKVLRPKSYAVANFKSMARTIRSNLNRAQRNLFLKDNYDLFDDDLKIRTSLYQEVRNGVIRLKEPKILFEIEERVRKLSKDVRTGVYSSEDSVKYKKWADRKIRKLENELVKTVASKTKEKTIYVRVGMDEVEVEAVHEVPPAVQRFLDRAIKLYATEGPIADTKVKSLSGKDDVHVKMSCEEFFSLNAETLHHLTQNDVDEITDFYCSTATVTKNPVYSAIELYTLGYFVKMSGSDAVSFTLSDERLNNIENLLEFVAHKAGTDLSVWKSVEKMIRPEETIHKAMLKLCNIELSPNTEGELIKAINSKDLKRIQAAKQRAYEEVKDRYGSKKRTIFERLLRYEQMAMLSGPGTWVRNLASNVLVTGTNSLADVIGQILPTSKNSKKLNQYKIMGTKVGSGYAQWVKLNVMDSGLLDMFSDGLIKYDPRQSKKHGVENQLTKLIIDKIQSDLFNYSPKSNKFDKFNSSIQGFLRIVMSDKWAINKSFEKYLGKMLTEDKADVSEGLSREIMDTIADAYVMALQDYMHTKGCFGRMEDALRTYLHKRFNPTVADGVFFMYKQVMPFANASWNWFVEGLNYTPFGLAKGIYNFCRLENTVNAMESARQKGETVRSSRFAEYLAKRNIVKGSIGTAGFIVGALLAAFGLVELDDDDDKYKLKFNSNDGPFYVDFSNLFGTSGLLWGMSWVQGFIDGDGIDYDSLMKVLSTSLNTMFLDSTLADVFNTFRYSENIGDYLLGVPNDMLGMFFPNFIKTLANVSKKYKNNYSPGFIGKLEKFAVQCFAPFSYMMPYQINPYTGDAEVINEGWFGVNLVNAFTPIKVKNYNFGDTEKNAVLVGVKKGQLSGRYEIDGVKMSLTGEQVSNLNQFYGKLNQRELEDFMNNKTKYTVETETGDRKELTYSKMTEAEKKAVIERIMSNNGQLAKVYILTSNGYKYYASDSEYERLKKAGVISNVYRKQGKYNGFVKS